MISFDSKKCQALESSLINDIPTDCSEFTPSFALLTTTLCCRNFCHAILLQGFTDDWCDTT